MKLALIVEQQPTLRIENFVLLIFAVWGAVSDNLYKAKGGKRAPKWTVLKLAAVFGLLLVVIGLRGASEDRLIYLGVTFFVLGFAAYEVWRWFVRRKNPVPKWK
jgi:hypothetical protein